MAHKPGHILGKNEDSWNYLEVPTFRTIRGKVPYNKPIKLEDSTGFEDLQSQFDSGSNRGRTVEQKVEDYQGLGPGRIIIKGKTNTPAGIFFYPDNTEYAKEAVKDISDYQNLEQAFQSLAILGGAATTKARQNYNRPRQYQQMLETEKLNNIKPKNSANLVKELNGYFPSGNLPTPIQTAQRRMGMQFGESGVLGKNLKGISEDKPIPQWQQQENYALEDALEGFPVMTTTGKLNSKFNPYLTHAERKGWQPVPSPEELKRRGNLGRTWQHIDAEERKKNYKPEKIRRRKGETEAEFSNRYFNSKFDAVGLTEDAKFELRNMLDAKTLNQEQRRIIKTGISNPNFSMQMYKDTREALVEEFLDGLEFLGIKPSEVEAHHIAGLRQTAQLYEGLNRDEFPEMLKQMYKAGLFTGNDPNNLMAIIREGHYPSEDHPDITAVHEYLTEELGLYNQKLTGDFGVDIRDLSVEERIPIIQEYAKVVKRSYKVAEIAIRKAIDKRVQKDSPEAAAHAALDIQEYELSKSELDSIKSKIDEHLKFELTKPNYEALADSVFGGESAAESMRRRGIRPGKETSQLQLIKKPPRKKRTRKTDPTLGQVGSGWDITTQENDMEILFPDDDD